MPKRTMDHAAGGAAAPARDNGQAARTQETGQVARQAAGAGDHGGGGEAIDAPGTLVFRNNAGRGATLQFHCDGIVAHDDKRTGAGPVLLAASFAGDASAIKAVRHGLHYQPTRCTFDWWTPENQVGAQYLNPFAGGYRFSTPHKLGYGVVHLTMLAKMPSLLHSRTHETVWHHLVQATTTPMKREWMSWIIPALIQAHQILDPTLQHGMRMAICSADDATLDKLVSYAVKKGRVKV